MVALQAQEFQRLSAIQQQLEHSPRGVCPQPQKAPADVLITGCGSRTGRQWFSVEMPSLWGFATASWQTHSAHRQPILTNGMRPGWFTVWLVLPLLFRGGAGLRNVSPATTECASVNQSTVTSLRTARGRTRQGWGW